MGKSIKNYTSSVTTDKSISRMEKLLIEAGARNILKQHDNKICIGLVFDLPYKDENGEQMLQFKFSVNVDAVYKVLRKTRSRLTPAGERSLLDQAQRTAWKIEHDSLEITLAKIAINTVTLPQALFGYLFSQQAGRTFYEVAKETGFKQLGDGK